MVKIFFKTYGCQANIADSEGLISYLQDLGCQYVHTQDEADLIMVNTCAIRAKAEQKLFTYLGELAKQTRARPHVRIGVIGCVASYRTKEIYKRFSHVNFVFGAREDIRAFHSYLMDVITSLETIKQHYADNLDAAPRPGQAGDINKVVREKKLAGKTVGVKSGEFITNMRKVHDQAKGPGVVQKSYINIMTGCNNYCSYCIVPFTRGREQSYSIKYIVERVAREVAQGAKEVNLIGQNVNSYADPDDGRSFSQLLEEVAHVPGEFWVRYVSPHPKDITIDVVDVMAKYPQKLCDWVHLPLQAGSNTILEAMKRPYTVKRYMEVVGWIRDRMPKATITTDIIVGFPGETDEDYEGTRAVMEEVRYDHIFSFIYSPRKYTTAFKLGDPCPAEEKQKRLMALQKRQKEICLERNKRLEGTLQRVLVEKRQANGSLLARTSGNVRVNMAGDDALIATFTYVQIERAGIASLDGKLLESTKVQNLANEQISR